MKELGIPMVYGLDMIHGATYLDDATFYPQEVNLAATFDRSYAEMMGKVIAYESRAAMTPWVFSPVMDLSRNPSWPRVWESWGEDPGISFTGNSKQGIILMKRAFIFQMTQKRKYIILDLLPNTSVHTGLGTVIYLMVVNLVQQRN